MTSDTLYNGDIGQYFCETLDVSEYDSIHVDSDGDHMTVIGIPE